ncbi:MAG: hypothetical protein AVDCRST_MAG19-2579, partial [uncultured Thermomicrobiales bacterium]
AVRVSGEPVRRLAVARGQRTALVRDRYPRRILACPVRPGACRSSLPGARRGGRGDVERRVPSGRGGGGRLAGDVWGRGTRRPAPVCGRVGPSHRSRPSGGPRPFGGGAVGALAREPIGGRGRSRPRRGPAAPGRGRAGGGARPAPRLGVGIERPGRRRAAGRDAGRGARPLRRRLATGAAAARGAAGADPRGGRRGRARGDERGVPCRGGRFRRRRRPGRARGCRSLRPDRSRLAGLAERVGCLAGDGGAL